MSKMLMLTRVFLKNGTDNFFKTKKKGLPKSLSMLIIMAVLILSIGIPVGKLAAVTYDMLEPIGQQGIILALGLALVSAAIFLFGIFYVLTVFYFSKDIEYLLPLPLKPYEILGAKFITVVIYEYFTELVFLVPILLTYGLKSGAGLIYYFYSIVIFLTLPVIPLIMASVINMTVMRFTNLGKHKDAFKVVGGLIAMFLGLGINMYIQRAANSGMRPERLQEMLLEGNNSLLGMATRVFPSAKISSRALLDSVMVSGIVNLSIFLLISAAFLVIFFILAEGLYFKGVIGISESYSKRKKITFSELDKATVQNSALRAYTLKELRILFRTPAYLMNCVIINFLWPVFMLIPAVGNPGILNDIKGMNKYLQNDQVLGIIVAAGLAAGLFIAGSNGITSTAISREGQNLYVNKYLPMSYKEQIMAKVLSGIILNAIGVTVLIIFAYVLVSPPIYVVFITLVVALLGVTFSAFTGIFIDLNFPKLDWDNEQKAVKQNLNLIINMFLSALIAIGSIIITIKLEMTLWNTFGVIVVAFVLASAGMYYILSTIGERLYNKILN